MQSIDGVRTDRNKLIFYNFLAVGHKKFSIDKGFDMLKKTCISFIDCTDDLILTVKRFSEIKNRILPLPEIL